MPTLAVAPLGTLRSVKSGIYHAVNDRCINDRVISAIADKMAIYRRVRLTADAPVADIVGYLTGYEILTDTKGAGGYCDYRNQVIAISDAKSATFTRRVLCHEICHAIQADLGLFGDDNMLLSDEVKIEQQCETMAYYLHRSLFPELQVRYQVFDSYFSKGDILWLADWYKGYRENDITFKKQ